MHSSDERDLLRVRAQGARKGQKDGKGGKDTPLMEPAFQGEAPTHSQLDPADTSMHSPWGEWELA